MNRKAIALALGAAGLVAIASVPRAGCRHEAAPSIERGTLTLGSLRYSPSSRLLEIGAREVSLLLEVDGAPQMLPTQDPARLADGGLAFTPTVHLEDGEAVSVRLELHATDAQVLFSLRRLGARSAIEHALRVRLELADASDLFAAEIGDVADLGRTESPLALWTLDGSTWGATTPSGRLALTRFAYPGATFDNVGLAVAGPELLTTDAPDAPSVELVLAYADANDSVTRALFAARGEEPLRVYGEVRGASDNVAVYASDEQGAPWARALTESEDGGARARFELVVPKRINQFFAAERRVQGRWQEAARASMTTSFEPGAAWPLLLDLQPPGTCIMHVVDGDSGRALTSRVIVRGKDGTPDPWFGPDYRASGAGQVLDAKDGAAQLDLPSGVYRVQATHGPLFSIDEAVIEVTPSGRAEVTLRPRRVIPAFGEISADLHVHARPSFDSPVQPEDRVLSLIASGIEFAVPTEHNVVGDYDLALEILGARESLRSVPGVEVTTFSPRVGHFGVFPYPVGAKVPRYRGTSVRALFAEVHKDPSRLLVVHHPFLGGGLGYFDRVKLAPERGAFGNVRLDFDAIELLNGYETLDAKRTEQTLTAWLGMLAAGHRAVGVGSSDSHRILYGWAGYPRTLIRVANEGGEIAPKNLDVTALLAALRAGKAQATTGPVILLEVDGKQTGEVCDKNKESGGVTGARKLQIHLEAYAAPWVDLTRIDLYLDMHVAQSFAIDPVPLRVGPESGDPSALFARARRFARDFEIDAPSNAGFVLAVARGETPLDWVLPATALPPLAITNPVWLR